MRLIRKAAVGLFAAIGLLFVIVTITPVTKWWATVLSGPWYEADGDVLIVLGADLPNNGAIGFTSYWRAVYAAMAWRNGHFKTVAISGGNGISVSMKDFLVCAGVPAAVILTEERSTSTRENALFTTDLLRNVPGRKVLLTSDSHMYRASRVFWKAGLDIVPRPFPDALKRYTRYRHRWWVFIDLVIETAKIGYYRVRGWM